MTALPAAASRGQRPSEVAATSLYVHVPFCVVKCGYCDFNSWVPDAESALDRYLDGLDRELALGGAPRAPCSVFVGGGTPSYLDEARLERLLAIVGRHVDLQACPEVTMEANPESVTRRKGEIARAGGVTRVSLGAQSFDARYLKLLDRAHSAAQTREAVSALRAAGFANLSLDLMFSLPGQTLAEWEHDLGEALALEPDHLSCYSLTFEPGTRFHRDRAQGKLVPSEPEADRALFLRTRERLGAAGFVPYEISNFAGRGGPCRHNDHYWLQGDYAGVGPGAASHRAGVRWSNVKALEPWCRSLDRGLPPVAEAETLTRRQRAAEALWLGIRRAAGVDLEAVRGRVGLADLRWLEPVLGELSELGLVRLAGARLTLTERGLLLGDTVGERLLNA